MGKEGDTLNSYYSVELDSLGLTTTTVFSESLKSDNEQIANNISSQIRHSVKHHSQISSFLIKK